MEWKLAEAKNRFSEVVNKALIEGPQRITRRQDCVILLNEEEYKRLTKKRKSLKRHLMEGPSLEDLELDRDSSPMREIEW